MEKSRFETFLSCYLTEAQIGLLKESLLANRAVYFYGAEGTGKSMLCSIFRLSGFDRVFEPGILASGGADEPVGVFTLPKNPHGVVLLELYGRKRQLDLTEALELKCSDIETWLTT